jgi:hypothetical protein
VAERMGEAGRVVADGVNARITNSTELADRWYAH